MSFGLTQQQGYPVKKGDIARALSEPAQPVRSAREIALYEMPETQLAAPRVEGPGRIQKHQLICRKCHKPVERTEQFREYAGRTIINCTYSCHGETGFIRVCDDQWGYDARMLVLEGLPELCNKSGKPLMIADSAPEVVPVKSAGPAGTIDIEAEVVTGDMPGEMRRLN